MHRVLFSLLALLPGLTMVVGCGGQTTVHGTVTYNGQPVERGSIRFVSTDRQGPTFGAVIKNGQYTIEKAVPGPKVVTIHAVNQNAVPTSSGQLQQMAEQAKTSGNRGDDPLDPLVLIPPDAEGNNQQVEIKAGRQALDFHLKSRRP